MKTFLTIFFVLIAGMSFTQEQQDSTNFINLNFEEYCNDNFSLQGDDSLFVNYYISNYKDTIFFQSANCIIMAEPSTPPIFRRRILNGWADGDLQVFNKNDSTYSWTHGVFKNGVLTWGSFYVYCNNGAVQLTGQYAYGHRNGVWTWYYPNGKKEEMITYVHGDPVQQVIYNNVGEIIELYDVVKEIMNDSEPSE